MFGKYFFFAILRIRRIISCFKALRHSIKRKLTYVRAKKERESLSMCVIKSIIINFIMHIRKLMMFQPHACVEFNAAILLALGPRRQR